MAKGRDTRRVPKKPCPYCGKKLEARNKRKFHNNLARHLSRTCAPFQREHMAQMLTIVNSLLRLYFPDGMMQQTGFGEFYPSRFLCPEDPKKRNEEIAELERIHALTAEEKKD